MGLFRTLEVLPRDRFPARGIEVTNPAVIAGNSHVNRPFALEGAAGTAEGRVI